MGRRGARRVPADAPRGPAAVDGLRGARSDRVCSCALIPEWADVRCRPQRDPYHRYTVDMHLLRAFERRRARSRRPTRTIRRRRSSAVDRSGAGRRRCWARSCTTSARTARASHVPVGDRRRAARSSSAMGVDGSTRELATFMVAQHLLLPDTATRRDLSDDDLILDVAARVETPERLAALYLLAKADALATGPAAWTPWRQALDPRARGQGPARARARRDGRGGRRAARRTRSAACATCSHDEPPAEVERFILRMPRELLPVDPTRRRSRGTTPRSRRDLGRNDVRTSTRPGARPGAYELLVVAADRPGLLSWIAGALALGRALHPDGAGVHDRGRRGRRPVRGAGRVRARGGRGAVA